MGGEREGFLSETQLWQRSINEAAASILRDQEINPTPRRVATLIHKSKQFQEIADPRVLHREWEYIQHLAIFIHYPKDPAGNEQNQA